MTTTLGWYAAARDGMVGFRAPLLVFSPMLTYYLLASLVAPNDVLCLGWFRPKGGPSRAAGCDGELPRQ